MNRIIRWYNKNRKLFWIVIFFTIVVCTIPRALNEYAKNKQEISSSNEVITTTYGNKDYAIISQKEVEEADSIKNNNIINNFIDYCNNKEVQKAYDLLSNECKEKMYPTVNDFVQNYFNNIFINKKIYSIQAWNTENNICTYKVNLKEDILSTGNANVPSIEDYYTIIKENGENKLNINNYVQSKVINKIKETNEIKISVISKDVYMDYEIYNIKVESKNGKSILLDSLESSNTTYLLDTEDLKYISYSHELVQEELRVRGEKSISIKFNKKYDTKRDIKSVVFSDIILDYDNYISYTNKKDFKNRIKIEIEL